MEWFLRLKEEVVYFNLYSMQIRQELFFVMQKNANLLEKEPFYDIYFNLYEEIEHNYEKMEILIRLMDNYIEPSCVKEELENYFNYLKQNILLSQEELYHLMYLIELVKKRLFSMATFDAFKRKEANYQMIFKENEEKIDKIMGLSNLSKDIEALYFCNLIKI